MSKQQIQEKIIKLQEELKKIEEAEKEQDYQKIIYKNKEFRIYKWENKQFKDFSMPKGFDFAEANEFIELYDNDKIELEVWKYYITKHISKKQQKKVLGLSWFYLSGDLVLYSSNDVLANSDEGGRVVISSLKERK